ncbi:MAG: TIGR02186 family protein [Nitrospirota bacterium]
MNIKNTVLITAVVLFALFALSVPEAFCITTQVVPDRINVDSLYHGGKIDISGVTTPGSDVIIKISSAPKAAHLRKKGKTGGLLWMNVGELEFNPVSDVYLVYSTNEIRDILSQQQQDTYALGYDAFRRSVTVSPVDNDADREKWTSEFIKMKEMNKTYAVSSGDIKIEHSTDKDSFLVHVDWPYQAPPETYTVTAYSVRDGSVEESSEGTFTVEKVGALRFLSDMAFNGASTYGIVSIIIAVAAGFIVSIIFRGGKGGAH